MSQNVCSDQDSLLQGKQCLEGEMEKHHEEKKVFQ